MPKGFQQLSPMTPFVLKRLKLYGSVSFKSYSFYQSQSTLPKKIGTKETKRGSCTKIFRFFYNNLKATLTTGNSKQLNDLVLKSVRIKMSQSDKIIIDNRNTIDFIVDFEQKIKEKNQFFKS